MSWRFVHVCLPQAHRLTAPISTVTGANRLIPGGSFGKVLTCCCLKTLKRVFLTHKPTSLHCSALTVEIQLQPDLAGLFTDHSRDCNCAISPINAQFVFRAIFLVCFAPMLVGCVDSDLCLAACASVQAAARLSWTGSFA